MSRLLIVLLVAIAAVMLAALWPLPGLPSGRSIPDPVLKELQSAERFEVISLDPRRRGDPLDEYHGWKVLGRTWVGGARREKLVEALKSGVFWQGNIIFNCFVPRHGIRLIRGFQVVDLVISFECRQVQVYVPDEQADGFLISGSPQLVFNEILRGARIPLPAGK